MRTDQIHLLTAIHTPQIRALWKDSYERPWSIDSLEQALTNASYLSLGHFMEKDLIGFCLLQNLGEEAEIHALVVHKDHRQQGIGSHLIKTSIKRLQDTGVHSVFLEVRVSNKPAQNLYESHGFNPIGRRKNYYPNPTGGHEDALILEKIVRP